MLAPTQGFAYQSSPCYWDILFTTRQDFDRNSENQPYIEFWKSQEDDVDGDYGTDNWSENLDKTDGKIEIKKKDNGRDDGDNIVRIFIHLMDEGDIQLYLDQLEVIEGFVGGASLRDFQSTTQLENEQPVALLDERSTTSGKCRKYKGPLVQRRLYEELSKKVA
jgi:hypothetical protein